MELIQQFLSYFSRLMMCPSFSILFNSVFTLPNKRRVILLPLLRVGLEGESKYLTFLSNGIFLTLEKRLLNCLYKFRIVFMLIMWVYTCLGVIRCWLEGGTSAERFLSRFLANC